MIETGGPFAKTGGRFGGRNSGGDGEARAMRRSHQQTIPSDRGEDFERAFFRAAVDELSLDRARCNDCGRTPLIGEDVHRYGRGVVVCELCRMLRPEAPESTERVRHSESGQAVRLRRVA
jgi:hypothetical protein